MKLPLFMAALKDSKVSTIIFCSVLVFYGMLLMSAFASVKDTLSDPFAEFNGAEIIELEGAEGDVYYNLSWTTQAGVLTHIAVGAPVNDSMMSYVNNILNWTSPGEFADMGMSWDDIEKLMGSEPGITDLISDQGIFTPISPLPMSENGTQLIYMGEGSFVNFRNTEGSAIFFIALVPDDGNLSNVTIKGPVSLEDLDVESGFDAYLEDNPFVEGILGGGEMLDFTTLEGYISLEYFSMWPLFLIIFIAIRSGGLVSKHVEDRSLDILLATGYSRSKFLNEKMLLVALNFFLVIFSGFLGVVLGTMMIGESVPWIGIIMGFLDSVPMALGFIGISLLISVLIDEGAKSTGIIMGIVVGEYILRIVANLVEWGDTLKWLTLFSYSNPNGALIDHVLDPVNILVPLGVAAVTITLAYVLFKKKEIHT